jgi:hypothetical protein
MILDYLALFSSFDLEHHHHPYHFSALGMLSLFEYLNIFVPSSFYLSTFDLSIDN